MQIKDIFNKVIHENFIAVTISTGLTMNEYHNPIIVTLIEDCCPDYWELLTPSPYVVYFRSSHAASRQHADKLIKGIQELILNDDKFEDFRVGIAEGKAITKLNWRGRVMSLPIGEAGSEASKNAKGKQDLAQQ